MKNIIVIGFFLILYLNGLSQNLYAKDSIEYYIKNLSWNSIRLTPTYVPYLMLNYDAQAILDNIADTSTVSSLLLKQIKETDKVVSVHVILSKMYEPKNNKFKQYYVYRGDSIIAVNYFYNTLKWQYDSETGNYQIAPESIRKIKEYWEKKLLRLQYMNKASKQKQSKKYNKALKRGL